MAKLALTVTAPAWEAPLSQSFSSCGWVLVYDTQTEQRRFVRNEWTAGRLVADGLASLGCTDAIFSAISAEGIEQLGKAGIRGWYTSTRLPAHEVVRRLLTDELLWVAGTRPRQPPRPRRY